MAKLPTLTARKLLKLLHQAGFVNDHQTGSHLILYHADGRRAVVPMHNQDLPKGTLRSILREAGIDPKEL
jgi:predicted RNA binding protein YcfA (HicA-like mRNA interferase family)